MRIIKNFWRVRKVGKEKKCFFCGKPRYMQDGYPQTNYCYECYLKKLEKLERGKK
jgi:hypothetical protein